MNHPVPIGTRVTLPNWENGEIRSATWKVSSHQFLPDYALVSIADNPNDVMQLIAPPEDLQPARAAKIRFSLGAKKSNDSPIKQ